MNESDKPTGEVRLLADAMLGKLAKWLRLLGYDTAYDPAWDDAAVVRLARAEGRVVLTRDRVLSERRGLRALLLTSDELEEQMAQIMNELHLPPAEAGSRCSICNAPLQPVAKAEVAERLPPYVLRTQEVFHRCPRCDRVYWPGGHWARMQPVLNRLRGEE
ncbi:MAG: Mut7-C RNAse domain-containing protein [Anaerolineae bacterium]|nr:Mut7-C RNAse domain-containing protein [Anaerolineae bacterium]